MRDSAHEFLQGAIRFTVGFVVGAIVGLWLGVRILGWRISIETSSTIATSLALGLIVGVLAVRYGEDVWNRLGWGP